MNSIRIDCTVEDSRGDWATERLLEEEIPCEVRDGTTLDRPPAGQRVLSVHVATDEEAGMRARLSEILGEALVTTASVAIEGDGWRDRWKEHFHTLLVGHFVVAPSWEPQGARAGKVVIQIDPGRAFGTGGHASTRLCLRALGGLDGVGRFLDVGCGSGILAIACALRWPGSTGLAVDVDPEAVEVTGENIAINGVADRIAASTTPVADIDEVFDVVLANITAETIRLLREHLAARVRPGGSLILSGILTDEADGVSGALGALGFEETARDEEDEWSGLTLVRKA